MIKRVLVLGSLVFLAGMAAGYIPSELFGFSLIYVPIILLGFTLLISVLGISRCR